MGATRTSGPRATARAVALVLLVVSPAVAAAQSFTGRRTPDGLLAAGVAHATTDLTNGHRFSIAVRHARRVAAAALPAACGVGAGLDAVVVELTLRNLEPRPFAGRVEHFVLVWELAGRVDGNDAEDVACAAADPSARYFGALAPPIPPRGERRVRLLFPVPSGARPVRLDYHDDDAPTRFALP